VLYGPHYMMGDWHHFIPDPARGSWAIERAPHIWEIPSALPDAFFMDGAEIARDKDDALDRLAAIAPAPKIVFETSDVAEASAPTTFVPAEATIEDKRVTVTVDAPRAGFVLVNETYYPGWVATVDGDAVPILRANAFVRAVRVGAGKHRIVMEFRPWEPRVLEPLALVALALIAIAAIARANYSWRERSRRRGRRGPSIRRPRRRSFRLSTDRNRRALGSSSRSSS